MAFLRFLVTANCEDSRHRSSQDPAHAHAQEPRTKRRCAFGFPGMSVESFGSTSQVPAKTRQIILGDVEETTDEYAHEIK